MCCNLFQQEIHKKIMSLNFRDCHAKIRQVDSQATVGNAVVVQVNISKTQQHQHDDFLTQKNRREHVCGPYSPCILISFIILHLMK